MKPMDGSGALELSYLEIIISAREVRHTGAQKQ